MCVFCLCLFFFCFFFFFWGGGRVEGLGEGRGWVGVEVMGVWYEFRGVPEFLNTSELCVRVHA